ncbi:LuxR C-terminal-related transcriptional regulator [Kribbella sp. NPDC058245]|uniref:helix-turn-helix transcriptional regulator n=1 Tax=Kribbella sp. NPDC058245 TaxID=3346399 RepID=UPI0036ED25B8
MQTYHAESARAGIEAAAQAGLPWREFALAAVELLERAIPYDALCVGIADPTTGMMTGSAGLARQPAAQTEFLALEYGVPDFNRFADLAKQPVAVGILDDATGGDPGRSPRQHGWLAGQGLRHELRGVVRSSGRMWGGYALYRSNGRSGFSPAEAAFMHRVESTLGLGLRRGLIAASIERNRRQRDGAGAAVLVFDRDSQVLSATPAAEQRVLELGGELWSQLPLVVTGLVLAARATVTGSGSFVPEAKVRSRTGEWLSLHAGPVRNRDGFTGEIAVSIEPAGAAGVIPLVVAAYGLTDRERDVVQQVLAGASTREIATGLHLSPYTVQDHLKAVFEKVGVSSRRELASRIFFTQYAGRLDHELDANGWFEE